MNQASTESKFQQVKVQHLELGMYVVGIAQQSHQNEIKRSGHVTSRQQIQEMLGQGVLVVWIDPSRTLHKEEQAVEPPPHAQQIAASVPALARPRSNASAVSTRRQNLSRASCSGP